MIEYAPYIAETIPGFVKETGIKIPFTMNPAIGWNDFEYFVLKIYDYNDNIILKEYFEKKPNKETSFVTFKDKEIFKELKVKTYYKFLLAYSDELEPLSNLKYSNISIGKYIQEDKYNLTINNWQSSSELDYYSNTGLYIGNITNPNINDLIYSYRFVLSLSDSIIEDSGEIIKTNNDMTYSLKYNMIPNDTNIYKIKFFITTINGYQEESGQYLFINNYNQSLHQNITINYTKIDLDNGYNELTVYNGSNSTVILLMERISEDLTLCEKLISFTITEGITYIWKDYTIESGVKYFYSIRLLNQTNQYITDRKFCEEDKELNYKSYNYDTIEINEYGEIFQKLQDNTNIFIKYFNNGIEYDILFDNTNIVNINNLNNTYIKFSRVFNNENIQINTSITYSYSNGSIEINYVNLDLLTGNEENKKIETSIKIPELTTINNYEDIFLTDTSGRQLTIKFNPKISNFKEVIQETKIETIGSQFPFFFRNGNIKYKEIPISGLISYHMDDNFITKEELGLSEMEKTTSLTARNILLERRFKLKVLEWLNNGEPKLFRSPQEGIYVIRLMNISLSPNDTVGRMLHTFNATGYEISKQDLDTLRENGYIKEGIKNYTIMSALGYFIIGTSELGGIAQIEQEINNLTESVSQDE